jgi:hypothetical protein
MVARKWCLAIIFKNERRNLEKRVRGKPRKRYVESEGRKEGSKSEGKCMTCGGPTSKEIQVGIFPCWSSILTKPPPP